MNKEPITILGDKVTVQLLPYKWLSPDDDYNGEDLETLTGYIVKMPQYPDDDFAICKYNFQDFCYAGVHVQSSLRATNFFDDPSDALEELIAVLQRHEVEIKAGGLIDACVKADLKRRQIVAWHEKHADERILNYVIRDTPAQRTV